MKRWTAPALLALAFLGCSSDSSDASAPTGLPAFQQSAFYEKLISDADAFDQVGGDWVEDMGDAPFYGLAFYARTEHGDHPARTDKMNAARARELNLLQTENVITGDVNELAMSTFGLMDDMVARGSRDNLPTVDAFIDQMDKLVAFAGWYLDGIEQNNWAFQSYGPTSISALVGLINAQYAYVLGGDRAKDRTDWAIQMEQKISDKAWNGAHYTFGGGKDLFCIYPNDAMLLLEARLYQLTGDEKYRQRAIAIYQGIQPLKLSSDPVRYESPYSAAEMGAKTSDYTTLSATNYLMLAFMVLYEITGDTKYVAEVDSAIGGIATQLVGTWCRSQRDKDPCTPACDAKQVCLISQCADDACSEGVLHHWMDGRIAIPSDTEFFCAGCNLQLLYVLWYRQGLR